MVQMIKRTRRSIEHIINVHISQKGDPTWDSLFFNFLGGKQMADDSEYREVDYYIYCEKCKHYEDKGYESVCEECLDTPINLYTNKPIKYEEK